MKPFAALTVAQFKGFYRDKQNLFWVILFPLMFLVLFGAIFTDTDQSKSELVVVGDFQLLDRMPPAGQDEFHQLFEVTRTDDEQAALEQVRKGDVDAMVQEKGTTVVLHYSQSDQVKAATVRGTMESFVQATNQAISRAPQVYSVDARQVEDSSLKAIQYLAPGLLGWAVAMGATFGAAMVLVSWRTTGLLRRLRLSPVTTTQLVLSRTLISLVIATLQLMIFVGVGVAFFGLKLVGSWWMALPLVYAGTLAFMAIGLFAGAVSKTEESASGLANLIILPMAFLSGSFIPLDAAPPWIQTTANFLPMGHLNEGMLNVMVRGQGPSGAYLHLAVLLGFAVIMSAIAAKIFRWDK